MPRPTVGEIYRDKGITNPKYLPFVKVKKVTPRAGWNNCDVVEHELWVIKDKAWTGLIGVALEESFYLEVVDPLTKLILFGVHTPV